MRRLLLASLGASALVAACGGSSAAPAPVAAPAPSTSAAVGVVPSAAPSSAPTVPSTVPPPKGAAAGGSCAASLSGSVAATVSRPGGVSAAASSLWFDSAELARSGFAGPGQVAVVVNCDDQSASINLLLGAATPAAAVPAGPGTYPITADGRPGTFTLLLAVPRDPRVWRVVEGEVRLSAHDTTHLAGEFRARLAEQGRDGADLVVTGRFDYPCTAGARCGR